MLKTNTYTYIWSIYFHIYPHIYIAIHKSLSIYTICAFFSSPIESTWHFDRVCCFTVGSLQKSGSGQKREKEQMSGKELVFFHEGTGTFSAVSRNNSTRPSRCSKAIYRYMLLLLSWQRIVVPIHWHFRWFFQLFFVYWILFCDLLDIISYYISKLYISASCTYIYVCNYCINLASLYPVQQQQLELHAFDPLVTRVRRLLIFFSFFQLYFKQSIKNSFSCFL